MNNVSEALFSLRIANREPQGTPEMYRRPDEVYGTLWKVMECHRTLWKIMENYGKFWKVLEISENLSHRNPWKVMEGHGKSWNLLEYSMGF